MKLSDLIQFLNYLDQFDLKDCHTESLDPVGKLASMVQTSHAVDKALKDSVRESFNEVDVSLQNFTKSIKSMRQQIMYQVVELEKSYYEDSLMLFRGGFRKESVRHILTKKMAMTPQATAIFEQRLKIYTSWQFPGLVFRPIHLSMMDEIVALDPLYLIDSAEGLLVPIIQSFNDRYQRRVRNYLIDEYASQDIPLLDDLPKGQFSLVAAQDYLNFKPLELVNRIITEVFDLLRPGGAFVFTFNNCDYAGAVKLVENHFTCYTPGRIIKQVATAVGYIVNYEYNEINGSSIMELRKPGEKISLRGGQTLAVIKDGKEIDTGLITKKLKGTPQPKQKIKEKKPDTVDTSVTRLYTDEERQTIRLSAVILGIDTEQNVNENYPIEVLEGLVNDRLNKSKEFREKFNKRLTKLIQKRNTK